MKKRSNIFLLALIVLLSGNLVLESCRKEQLWPANTATEHTPGLLQERTLDSLDFYKNLVARCVARGLGNTDFQVFFRKVSARGEGNQNGFSLWRYRDSLVAPNMSLARFLSMQSSQLGYSYNTEFFRGHLVRYIPRLSIGISLWSNVNVQDFVFNSTLKVAAVPSGYYSDALNAGNSTLYGQTLTSQVADIDNANYDFVYVEENPYYELFKTSNNRSLSSDQSVLQMHAFPDNAEFDAAFLTDASGSNFKFRLPGLETIGGVSCYLVDKGRVFDFVGGGSTTEYIGGNDGGGSNPGDGGDPGGGGDPADDRDGEPCTGDCERDGMDGYERVRFVQMADGSDLRKKFGCKRIHSKCTFAITEYRFVPDENSSAAVASQTTKVVSLWEKGLRKGEWVWWNDIDNKYVRWRYCEGEYGDQMIYGVIGKNPNNGTETTTEFTAGSDGVKFKIFGIEVNLPIKLGSKFTKKKTEKDFDFGQTENVYYCDPCSANGWAGQTYSTGSVRLRIREME